MDKWHWLNGYGRTLANNPTAILANKEPHKLVGLFYAYRLACMTGHPISIALLLHKKQGPDCALSKDFMPAIKLNKYHLIHQKGFTVTFGYTIMYLLIRQ